MIYEIKKYGFKIAEIWFREPDDFKRKHYLVVNYHDMREPVITNKCEQVLSDLGDGQTLVNYLAGEDELIGQFDSSVRYKVRRAIRDGVVTDSYFAIDRAIESSLIKRVCLAHCVMYKAKGMLVEPIEPFLYQLEKRGILMISIAKYEQKEIAYHVYILGDNIARLLYSISTYREDVANSAVIGRGNRLLHYRDMEVLKERGYMEYDWGGYNTKDKELLAISCFKAGFGGKETWHTHKSVVPSGFFPRLYQLYLKMVRFLRKRK